MIIYTFHIFISYLNLKRTELWYWCFSWEYFSLPNNLNITFIQ